MSKEVKPKPTLLSKVLETPPVGFAGTPDPPSEAANI